jgi:hypothetical protein
MEIYEKKHLFDTVLYLAKYLCWLVLGIALLRTGPDAWWRYPDWAWWVAVAMAVRGTQRGQERCVIFALFPKISVFCQHLT